MTRSLYCDISQTLLAWDLEDSRHKSFEHFLEICYKADPNSLLSKLGRNDPAMVLIKMYYFENTPNFDKLTAETWRKIREILWQIKSKSVEHYPEHLNLFLRRMFAKHSDNFVAFFFAKLRQMKREKDQYPEKCKKWRLKGEIETVETLKEEFFEEVESDLGLFLSFSQGLLC